MVTLDEMYADLNLWEEAAPKPRPNPQKPAPGQRCTYIITFDWGRGDTDGMLDVLRGAGFWAVAQPRFPRTTIICRTAVTVGEAQVLTSVSGNLEDNGSATVARLGGNAWMWPDRPWPGAKRKSWRRIKE